MLNKKQILERSLGIGGSDIPIILGVSTYKTPYQLYMEKIEGIKDEGIEETKEQYWGNVLEPVIRNEFEKKNNVRVEILDTIVNKKYSYLRANLDGFITDWNAIFEVKTCNQFMAYQWGESNSNDYPLVYLLQIAYYCFMMEAEKAILAVLIGGNDYREYEYIRDEKIEEKIVTSAIEFWDKVQKRTPPEPVCVEDLRLMFPSHKIGKIKQAPTQMLLEIDALSCYKKTIKTNQKICDDYTKNIMGYMQDAEILQDLEGNTLVSWKSDKRGLRKFIVKS